MVKQEPVSVGWQIVFIFIPFVSIWAYYRIEKLAYGILLGLGLSGLTYAIMFSLIGMMYVLDPSNSNSSFGIFYLIAIIAMYVIPIWIQVHFMLKWSRTWNQKVSHSTQ